MTTPTLKRAGRRDTKGGTFPLYDKPMGRRFFDATDEQWQHCKSQPEGAAAYIRRLIEADRQGQNPQKDTGGETA